MNFLGSNGDRCGEYDGHYLARNVADEIVPVSFRKTIRN